MVDKESEALGRIMDVPKNGGESLAGKNEPAGGDEARLILSKYKPAEPSREKGLAEKLPLALSGTALLISLIALFLALTYHPGSALPKGELGGIADDLKALRDNGVEFKGSVNTMTLAEADIPVSDAVESQIQIPVEMELPLSGTVVGTSPWGSTVSIPVTGTVPLKFVASFDLGKGEGTIHLKAELPGTSNATLAFRPSGDWRGTLDSIIGRLENISGEGQ